MPENDAFQQMIRRAITAIRDVNPFFATLMLFAEIKPKTSIPTAATDGKDLFFNPDFMARQTQSQRAGVFLHEVLHAALLHVTRRGGRDALYWNIAADIVVNGMVLREHGLDLPNGAIVDKSLEKLSVEEVYQKIISDPKYEKLVNSFDLEMVDLSDEVQPGELGERWRSDVERHWRSAMKQAETITRGIGSEPLHMEREMEQVDEAKIDWRSYLWRFLVVTPNDFRGFDRRSISSGYYFEQLEGEMVHVAVCIDTSGSISNEEMGQFTGEVLGILNAYPHLICDLYYADASVYGPWTLKAGDTIIPPPVGGGGTDFRPFFQKLVQTTVVDEPAVCVYLTDGLGYFPEEDPAIPTLWVIIPGGINLAEVPFGESVRLDS